MAQSAQDPSRSDNSKAADQRRDVVNGSPRTRSEAGSTNYIELNIRPIRKDPSRDVISRMNTRARFH